MNLRLRACFGVQEADQAVHALYALDTGSVALDNLGAASQSGGNDITLFPGESQTLTVTYDSADLQGATPVISVSGWNVPKTEIAAPVP